MGKKKEPKEEKYILSPLNNPMLNYNVYVMTWAEKLAYFVLTFVIGGAVGFVFYGGLFKVDGESTTATYISNAVVFVLVGLIAARVFLPAITENLKNKRRNSLQRQFMTLLEALSTSLSAGTNLRDAFFNAKNDLLGQYEADSLIIVELSEIIAGIQNGKELEEMLQAFGTRSANEDIINFSNVISNCYRLGGNFNDVVRRTREIISDKVAVSDEIETKISSNKMQHNAMCIMPVILVAMIKMSSDQLAAGLTSITGVLVTTVAVGIFIGAYFWGQKIIDIR